MVWDVDIAQHSSDCRPCATRCHISPMEEVVDAVEAIEDNRFPALRAFVARGEGLDDEWLAETAAYYGRMDMLRLLCDNNCGLGPRVAVAAVRGGGVEMLRFLASRRCPMDERAVAAATKAGDDACSDFLRHRKGK